MPNMDTYGAPEGVTPDPDQMLTRKEAAALIGFSISTLKRWDRVGILTASRSPSGQPRYRRADLIAAMKNEAA